MENVLTLIANPGAAQLTRDATEVAAAALSDAGATGDILPHWLEEGIACDLPFSGIKPDVADEAVRQFLRDSPIDIVAQPKGDRRKKLLVADMDSTMIAIECIDEIADYAGKRAEVAAITERAMRGELNFSQSLLERAAMLAGLGAEVLEQAFQDRLRLMPGARELVGTMRANGAYTALVSGGFTFFTERVRTLLGFDADQANDLIIEDGKLTGEVVRPILDPSAKQAALERLMERLKIDRAATLAVGDGANDIPLIQSAGLGVAYHAKPLVAAAAKARINYGDLTAVLYIQGYRREEFVTS